MYTAGREYGSVCVSIYTGCYNGGDCTDGSAYYFAWRYKENPYQIWSRHYFSVECQLFFLLFRRIPLRLGMKLILVIGIYLQEVPMFIRF